MTIINPNGVEYDIPAQLVADGGTGHAKVVTAGTGESLPRQIAIMADYIATSAKYLRTTSASSVVIGTGAKTFVLAVDLPYQAGEWVFVVDAANTANYMYATVTSYTSASKTLVLSVASGDTGGSGTITSWNVAAVGKKGETGATGATYVIGDSTAETDADAVTAMAVQTSGGNRKITPTNFFAKVKYLVNMFDFVLQRPELKDYSETHQTVAAASTTALDFESGNVITLTQDANIGTFTWSNPSPTGKACSFTLRRIKDNSGTSRTIAWPASVKWAAATAPTLTQTANAVDIFSFFTVDAGATWYGFVSGQAMA